MNRHAPGVMETELQVHVPQCTSRACALARAIQCPRPTTLIFASQVCTLEKERKKCYRFLVDENYNLERLHLCVHVCQHVEFLYIEIWYTFGGIPDSALRRNF